MYDYRDFYFSCEVMSFCAIIIFIFYLLVILFVHIYSTDNDAKDEDSVSKHIETVQNHYDNEEIQGLLEEDSFGI